MKILVIDGQGGGIGRAVISALRSRLGADRDKCELIAVGTNSIATSAMLKAGSDAGASGENAVRVACRDADVIIGPVGIVAPDSLMGELTPAMAQAVSSSAALKLLVPANKCRLIVAGTESLSVAAAVEAAAEYAAKLVFGQTVK